MFNIDCNNNIEVIAGDKIFLNFRLSNHKLETGDRVIFSAPEASITETVEDFTESGIAAIDIEGANTQKPKGTYDYTIKVQTTGGADDTVIIGKIKII